MTYAEQLAEFVHRASFDDLSGAARTQLKIRVLDSLGCAIGAIGSDPVRAVREQVEELDGKGRCTLIGGSSSGSGPGSLLQRRSGALFGL